MRKEREVGQTELLRELGKVSERRGRCFWAAAGTLLIPGDSAPLPRLSPAPQGSVLLPRAHPRGLRLIPTGSAPLPRLRLIPGGSAPLPRAHSRGLSPAPGAPAHPRGIPAAAGAAGRGRCGPRERSRSGIPGFHPKSRPAGHIQGAQSPETAPCHTRSCSFVLLDAGVCYPRSAPCGGGWRKELARDGAGNSPRSRLVLTFLPSPLSPPLQCRGGCSPASPGMKGRGVDQKEGIVPC